MYKRWKDNKGITIISLGIVITVLLIVSTTMILSVNDRYQAEELDKLSSDLQLLTEKTGMYYLDNKQYPTTGSQITITIDEENVYTYKIDLSKMDGLTLNYGKGDGEDYYTIDSSTGTVYYKKGIEGIYSLTQAEATERIKVVKIITQPQWQTVAEGETATLSVAVDVTEGVTYKWYKSNTYEGEGTPIADATTNTLTIENVDTDDAKYYYCEITYNGITIKSDVAKLSVI